MSEVAIEIPSFLLRNQPGDTTMGAQNTNASLQVVPPVVTKKKRADCYVARIVVKIPLDMSNSESLALAIKAVEGIKTAMPAGSVVDVAGTLGKV